MSDSKVQIIHQNGQPAFAVIPFAFYEEILRAFEDAGDVHAFDRGREELAGEEMVPDRVVRDLLDGEPPVRVWRTHRGLTLAELAERTGTTDSTLSSIESGRKQGSVELFRRIARVLDVSIDELVGWRDED